MSADPMNDADAAEVGRLFVRVSRDLFAHALLLTGGAWEDAEDLVQLTFHELVRDWGKVCDRDHSGRRAWLFTVASNQAVSEYRKRSRFMLDRAEDGAVLDLPSPPIDLERRVLARDLLNGCWAVISRMPDERRLVIVLHAYGESTAEIATRMGIAQATVRGHRANAVREIMEQVGAAIEILDGAEQTPSGRSRSRWGLPSRLSTALTTMTGRLRRDHP